METYEYQHTIERLEKMADSYFRSYQGGLAIEAIGAIKALENKVSAIEEATKKACAHAVNECVRQDLPGFLIDAKEAEKACINAKL